MKQVLKKLVKNKNVRYLVLLLLLIIPFITSLANSKGPNTDSIIHYLDTIYAKAPLNAVRVGKYYFHDPNINDIEAKAHFSLKIGASYYYLGKPDSCLYYLDTSLVLRKKIEDEEMLANGYNALSIIHFHMGNYDKALLMNKNALNVYSKLHDTIAMVNSLKGIANIYTRTNHGDSAININIEALYLLKNKNDTTSLNYKGGLTMNIGTLMSNLDKIQEAAKYYQEAKFFFIKTGNQEELARLYHNIADMNYSQGKIDTAIKYITKSIQLKKEHQMQRQLSSSLTVAADIYREIGRDRLAKKYYINAIEISSAVGDMYFYIQSLIALSQIYLHEPQPDSARLYLKRLEKVEPSIESPLLKSEFHKALSMYFRTIGNYKKALEEYKKYNLYSDTVLNAGKVEATLELEKKYQTALKEKENQKLKNQLLEKQLTEQRQQTWLYILIIGLSLLSIAVFLLIGLLRARSKAIENHKRLRETEKERANLEVKEITQRMASEKKIRALQEEKYEKDIELKNRKLATSAMQIMSKNNVLQEIETILSNSDESHLRMQVNRLLKNNVNFDKDWEQLRLHFEQVHPHFFSSLKKEFPGLTDYDLRLAAYLKINLTSKEIAQMLHVTPSAISKSRQRLRKKLGIDSNTGFNEFFKRFSSIEPK